MLWKDHMAQWSSAGRGLWGMSRAVPAPGLVLQEPPIQIQGKMLVFSAIPAAQLAKSPSLGRGE